MLRVTVDKRAAYLVAAALLVALIAALVLVTAFRSAASDLIDAVVRSTGIGLLPAAVWAVFIVAIGKSGYALRRKLRYIAGSIFCLLVVLMVMSYWNPWEGFWAFFTDDGMVPLSGTIGAGLAGEGFQRTLFIAVTALAACLLLAPPEFIRRVALWLRMLFDLVVNRVKDQREKVLSRSPSWSMKPARGQNELDDIDWIVPDIDFEVSEEDTVVAKEEIRETAQRIESKLAEFGVEVEVPVEDVRTGPKVSVYGIRPGRGVRVAAIQAREEDLDVELGTNVRFESIQRAQGLVGLEVPNSSTSTVRLGDLVKNSDFAKARRECDLLLALGLDSGGEAVLADLCDMPHLLIGGATNTGKSVFLNGLLSSLLLLNTPTDLQLLLIDPKQVEFRYYEDIPHLVPNEEPGNVVINPKAAEQLLESLQNDMSDRHRLMRDIKVRNIREYNREAPVRMPYMVIVIDELASLIHSAPGVKTKLVQLAQRGRAVGIHVIIATQRPEVRIIDGLIRAQFPARVAFSVASVRDSMIILDVGGAQKLLGQGDMLFRDVSDLRPARVQGVYVHDDEIAQITEYWRDYPKGSPLHAVPTTGS